MNFSIVIPSRDASNLVPAVRRIFEMEPGLPHERIICVDDGARAEAEAKLPGITWVAGVKPFQFPRNANLGMKSIVPIKELHQRVEVTTFADVPDRKFIQGPRIDDCFLTNDDCLLEDKRGFTRMWEMSKEHPEYGLIGATTNLTGQPLQLRQGFGLRDVPHFAFVCVLIPRRTIELFGGIDERYCLDYGCCDRDLCEAVTRAGYKCGVYDFCYVDHGSLRSSYRGDPKAPRSFAKNYALLVEKWGTLA